MSNIKVLYFDSNQLSRVEIESKLAEMNIAICGVGKEVLLVRYSDSPRQLYDSMGIDKKRIVILDMSSEKGSYWGFTKSEVWEWIKNNIE